MRQFFKRLITFDSYYWLGIYSLLLSLGILSEILEDYQPAYLALLLVLTAIQLFKRKSAIQCVYAIAITVMINLAYL